jgi:hypothetical protein
MPGPSTPGQAALTKRQLTPGISGTGDSFNEQAETQKEINIASSDILTTWRTFATALGQTAPGHVNRARRAIDGLRRYGG